MAKHEKGLLIIEQTGSIIVHFFGRFVDLITEERETTRKPTPGRRSSLNKRRRSEGKNAGGHETQAGQKKRKRGN